jgi:hypothetical protein
VVSICIHTTKPQIFRVSLGAAGQGSHGVSGLPVYSDNATGAPARRADLRLMRCI